MHLGLSETKVVQCTVKITAIGPPTGDSYPRHAPLPLRHHWLTPSTSTFHLPATAPPLEPTISHPAAVFSVHFMQRQDRLIATHGAQGGHELAVWRRFEKAYINVDFFVIHITSTDWRFFFSLEKRDLLGEDLDASVSLTLCCLIQL